MNSKIIKNQNSKKITHQIIKNKTLSRNRKITKKLM